MSCSSRLSKRLCRPYHSYPTWLILPFDIYTSANVFIVVCRTFRHCQHCHHRQHGQLCGRTQATLVKCEWKSKLYWMRTGFRSQHHLRYNIIGGFFFFSEHWFQCLMSENEAFHTEQNCWTCIWNGFSCFLYSPWIHIAEVPCHWVECVICIGTEWHQSTQICQFRVKRNVNNQSYFEILHWTVIRTPTRQVDWTIKW